MPVFCIEEIPIKNKPVLSICPCWLCLIEIAWCLLLIGRPVKGASHINSVACIAYSVD